MLFIVGSPRSGTSWLAKIFDSHPNVMLRHEPDTIIRNRDIPAYCESEHVDSFLPATAEYLSKLKDVRTSKVIGSVPFFPKNYENTPVRTFRRALAYGAKAGERVPIFGSFFRSMQIPDLTTFSENDPYLIFKSIAALGRTRLFLEAAPNSLAIQIIRHPCGHVASVLRGIEGQEFATSVPATEDFGIYEDLAATAEAKHYDLSFQVFKDMRPIERLAWRWAISNEKCMNDIGGRPDTKVIRYEDLCEDPMSVSRELFEFAGLAWNDQTERFIHASTSYHGTESFYQVFRDPKKSAYKWKEQLSQEQISQIIDTIAQTKPGALFI